MKKSLTLITLLAGAVGAYAQGTLTMGDYGNGFTVDVFAPNPANPTVEQLGQSFYDNPAGATQYGGVAIGGGSTGSGPAAYGNGNLWTIALYAAPGVNNAAGVTAAEHSGTPELLLGVATSGGTSTAPGGSSPTDQNGNLNTGTQGNDSAGAYQLNILTPGVSSTLGGNGTTYAGLFTGGATVQLAAWYNGGVATTLANAAAQLAAAPVYGFSADDSITALGGTGSPPAKTPFLAGATTDGGITSFSMVEVPEPSTIALGVIGASTFLFRRRK